jgi:hypothetical protein
LLHFEDVHTLHQAVGWEDCASPHIISGTQNGVQNFFVRVKEAPHAEASTSWTVDIAPPVVEFDAKPDPIITVGATAAFSITSTEPAMFLCDVDAGAISNPESLVIHRPCFYESSGCDFVPCNAAVTELSYGVQFDYAAFAPGRHNVTVRATDLAGNVGNVATWIFSLAECIADESCYPSEPLQAPVKECMSGWHGALGVAY